MEKRYGKIRISRESLENDTEAIETMIVTLKLVPFRAEMLFARDEIEIQGYSWMFDICGEGEMIPEYRVTFNRVYDENGDYTVEVEGVKRW